MKKWRHSRHTIRRRILSLISDLTISVLPTRMHIWIERKLQGWNEYRQIAASEYVVISYGKSGRTWLRHMISQFLRLRFGLETDELIRTDNFNRLNESVPVVFFTHNEYIDYFMDRQSLVKLLSSKKVLLLVRDPRDVTVSMYFHCKYRMKESNQLVNQFGKFQKSMTVFDFLTDSAMGLPATIAFNERALSEIGDLPCHWICRYEDLKKDTAESMRGVLEFLGFNPTQAELQECIASSTLEKMQSNERERRGSNSSQTNDEGRLKARRGIVGGYADYLTPSQQELINQMVLTSGLGPLGYKQ